MMPITDEQLDEQIESLTGDKYSSIVLITEALQELKELRVLVVTLRHHLKKMRIIIDEVLAE